MSAIILNNQIVHYEVLGRGRPVIFLHGWIGSWRYWIPAMQAISTHFRAYAFDFWGYGSSAKEPSRYIISQQTEMVKSFLYEMGIGKIAIIGHGLGAIVSLLFTEKYPQMVDRVIAISLPLETKSINPRLQRLSPQELADWLLGPTPENEAVQAEVLYADQDALLRTINSINISRITQIPSRLSTPCLLVNGLEDPAIAHPQEEQLNQLPANMHQITFSSSGHFPMIDQPGKFNRLINDFLALESGESPRELQVKEEWKRRLR